MGNAKIWYYPSPTGTVEEIDLGEALSDLQVETTVDQAVAEGLSGVQSTSQYSGRARIRVVLENFTSASVHRSLYTLRTHLQRGGLIALTEDSAYAWAAFGTQIPVRGSTSFPVALGPWPYASPTFTQGHEIELIGSQPGAIRELTTLASGTITSFGAQTLTLTALDFDFREAGARWVMARTRQFWPVLRMPAAERNQAMIVDDHRIAYTLDVTLEEAVDQYERWATIPGQVQTTTVTGHRRTLQITDTGNATGFGNFGLGGS
jgi:hypothetical protein